MKKSLKLMALVGLVATMAACNMDQKKNENQRDTTMAGANNTYGASNHDTLQIDTAGKKGGVTSARDNKPVQDSAR